MTDNLERTKKAMLGAPRGAYYVWPDKAIGFPRALAEEIGRSDLTIVTANFFDRKGRGYGMKVKIVTDPNHAWTVSQLCVIDRCNTLKEPR